MESYMRKLFVTLCAAASIFSTAALFSTTPAEAWGYRHRVYRHYVYRPYYRPYSYAYYQPYYSYAYYRPYRAYAYAGHGPRIWVGWGRRW